MKTWKEWLDAADRGERSSPESEIAKKIRAELEAKLGHPLPPGTIVESEPSIVELTITSTSSEDDVAKEVVRALREMSDVVANDMGKKHNLSPAKLKLLIAEEYYRQATAPATFAAKNFGDSKLIQ